LLLDGATQVYVSAVGAIPAGVTLPPAEELACPQASAFGKLFLITYRSSQVAIVGGIPDHFTRT
jgi:hypothetical protein